MLYNNGVGVGRLGCRQEVRQNVGRGRQQNAIFSKNSFLHALPECPQEPPAPVFILSLIFSLPLFCPLLTSELVSPTSAPSRPRPLPLHNLLPNLSIPQNVCFSQPPSR